MRFAKRCFASNSQDLDYYMTPTKTRMTTTRVSKYETIETVVDNLKERIGRLEEQLKITETPGDDEGSSSNPHYDETAIEQYVDELLQNEHVNFSFIPDYVEKKMYIHLFGGMLRTIQNVFASSQICLLKHRIRIMLEPMN